MFGKLKQLFKLKKSENIPEFLLFKSNAAAFEYACKYMEIRYFQPSDSPMVVGIVEQLPQHKSNSYIVKLALNGGVKCNCGEIITHLNKKFNLEEKKLKIGSLVQVDIGSYIDKYDFDDPMQYYIILGILKPKLRIPEGYFEPDVNKK